MSSLSHVRSILGAIVMAAVAYGTVHGQTPTPNAPIQAAVNRSGPRFGALWVSQGIIDEAAKKSVTIQPVLSLFGWQTEVPLGNNPGGPQPVSDIVLLGAGLDQSTFIPSASWIVGVRTTDDLELGVGPNWTPTGLAFVITAGMSRHFGTLNVPINIAYVPAKVGSRFSITTGFNTNK
jgi:hypothetical protein